jgi:hypothetical protein
LLRSGHLSSCQTQLVSEAGFFFKKKNVKCKRDTIAYKTSIIFSRL